MTYEARIRERLEAILDDDLTPEQACADAPELLDEVRARLTRVRRLEQHVEGLFPATPTLPHLDRPLAIRVEAALPTIPGYEVQTKLGSGGMGIVYQARQLNLNRIVAVKMLLLGLYAGPLEKQRFRREAEAIARLRHPHIVQVHDVGEANDRPYFTMEFVEGGTLSQKLAGAPQPSRESAELLASLARAVNAAHRAGVVHCDLKPGNILLTSEGEPKISDFGLARLLDGDHSLTASGAGNGTPSYMAPEQAAGDSTKIGPSCDVYGLGGVLYEMLTGRPPFRAATPVETLRQVATEEPAAPSRLNAQVSRDLQTICLKCLEKDPQRRYATAADLAADLERFLRSEPILARPVGPFGHAYRWAKRNPAGAAALASLALLVALIVAASLWAASHFRMLADQNGRIAMEREAARSSAVESQRREAELRRNAEQLAEVVWRSLYLSEMNLAGQAGRSPSGLGRVAEFLAHWEHKKLDLRQWEWFYLNALGRRSRATWPLNSSGMLYVAWDRPGQRLAGAGSDRFVYVWSDDEAETPRRFQGHEREVIAVAWSPDGARLASVSWDHTARVWNAASGEELFCYRGHACDALAIAWSDDGKTIASGGADGAVHLWNPTNGEVRRVLRGHDGAVMNLAWNPTGDVLATCSRDTKIQLWDTAAVLSAPETGAPVVPLRTLSGHVNWINRIAWRPDGARLVSVSNDRTAKIWNPSTGELLTTLTGHAYGVISAAWNGDGSQLVTGSDDSTLKVWSAETGVEEYTLRGHTLPVTQVAWNPHGPTLASTSYDGTLRLWNARSPADDALSTSHGSSIECLAWHPHESRRLAIGDFEGMVQVWDAASRTMLAELSHGPSPAAALAWHPTGQRLAIAFRDGKILLWDYLSDRTTAVLDAHAGEICGLAWSLDGLTLAAGGADAKIRIWDVVAGGEPRVLTGHVDPISALAFSPDGRRLASASDDRSVRIWNVATATEALCCRRHTNRVTSVAWSPTGDRLASAGWDQTVQIWDANDGQPLSVFRGHTAHVSQVAWHPDGNRLASACRDGVVKIWSTDFGGEALTLEHHGAAANAIAWSRDGLVLASGDQERRISLYDAEAGYAAGRSEKFLPRLDVRKTEGTATPVDARLRGEIHAAHGRWTQAGDEVRVYLAASSKSWMMLDGELGELLTSQLLTLRATPGQGSFDETFLLAEKAIEAEGMGLLSPFAAPISGYVDFAPHCERREHVSGCGVWPIYALHEQPLAMLIGSDDQARVWLNGKVVYESLIARRAVPDEDAVSITLQSGWNALLVQVVNETGEHELHLRFSSDERDRKRPPVRSAAAR